MGMVMEGTKRKGCSAKRAHVTCRQEIKTEVNGPDFVCKMCEMSQTLCVCAHVQCVCCVCWGHN